MQRLNLLIIVIGVFLSGLAYAQGEILSEEEAHAKGLVLVEPLNVMSTEIEGEYRLVSHRERRPEWGSTVSLVYSSYEPLNYEPNFVAANFGDVYSSPETPTLELVIENKRNFSFGSIGSQFSLSAYQNDSDNPDLVDSSLLLVPLRLGVVLAFDNLSPDAGVVPYMAAGVYTAHYREELQGNSFNGNTQVAPYFHGGVAFSVDWIDRGAARIAYEDSGVEGSYIFAEARRQETSSQAADPDLGSDIYWAAGFRVEL